MKNFITRALSKFVSKPGILGLECYFPQKFVTQSDLEIHDGIPEGKYTIGLGQETLSFHDDREDSVSIMLTAVDRLLTNYDISQDEIGAFYVGTETSVDRSKSVKSYMMELFDTSYDSNTNIEGVDNINACFGGTQSIFDALYWLETHYEQDDIQSGKYAVVVCGDCATYKEPAARPTSGVGAVAMLLGPNATLEFDLGRKFFHMSHVYDFYKPEPQSLYPTVHGHYSNECYLEALDRCYTKGKFNVEEADYVLFHSPYNKLVQKSVAFLKYMDWREEKGEIKNVDTEEEIELVEEMKNLGRIESYSHAKLIKFFQKQSKDLYDEKAVYGTLLSKYLGNSYSSALYFSLCSLIHSQAEVLNDKKILMYSYGSGLASGMFEINVNDRNDKFSLQNMKKTLDIKERLVDRKKYAPEEYYEMDDQNEIMWKNLKDYKCKGDVDKISEGTWYLDDIDECYRRTYLKK